MKKILFLTANSFIFFLLLLSGCNKSSGPSSPISIIPNKITITSITPAAVYTDEPLTITGTGFNTDMEKDTVDFGSFDIPDLGDPGYVNDTTHVFEPFYLNAITKTNYIVISASATQLVIKPLAPDSLYKLVFTKNYNHSSGDYNFRVRSKGASAVSKRVTLKNVPVIYAYNINDYPDTYALTPGDSTEVIISGVFSNNICDVSLYLSCSKVLGCTYADQYINNYNISYVPGPCTCTDFGTRVYGCPTGGNGFSSGRLVKYDELNHRATIRFLMPANFFNTTFGGGYAPFINITAKAINKDGRSSKVVILTTRIFPTH